MSKKSRNQKNNKTVNIIIIIGIVFLIASLILMLTRNKKIDNHIIDISYDEYKEIISKDEYSIILFTSPTCTHCQSYKPYVNYVCDDYDLIVYDLNLSSLSYDQYIEIHDKYNITKNQFTDNGSPSILTPTTIITKNDMEIDSISGNLGYSGFLNLLKKYDIIKK